MATQSASIWVTWSFCRPRLHLPRRMIVETARGAVTAMPETTAQAERVAVGIAARGVVQIGVTTDAMATEETIAETIAEMTVEMTAVAVIEIETEIAGTGTTIAAGVTGVLPTLVTDALVRGTVTTKETVAIEMDEGMVPSALSARPPISSKRSWPASARPRPPWARTTGSVLLPTRAR